MSKQKLTIHPALDAAIEELKRSTRELQDLVRVELGEIAASVENSFFVVLQPGLERLEPPLVERRILTILPHPPTELQDWVQRRVIVVVADETPYIVDAASCGCGVISVRELLDRESTHVAEIISDALIRRDLQRLRHGWLLLLRENGQHDFRVLSES
jgi:hypothetical protein